MYVEAAELSCCFGLNDTLPILPMLSSFVAKVIQIGKQERQEANGSLSLLNEASKRQLISLKSVAKCLEDYKFDVRNVGSIPIHGRIATLEKSIAKVARRLEVQGLKSKHLEAYKRSETQFKESFPSTEEASRSVSSQMIQDKPQEGFPAQPLLPVSGLVNSSISAAVSNAKDYPYDCETWAGYISLGMEYPAAQNFCQPQVSSYGNGGGSSGRNLYQVADAVIQHESQHGKPNRSTNTSPAAAKFSHY